MCENGQEAPASSDGQHLLTMLGITRRRLLAAAGVGASLLAGAAPAAATSHTSGAASERARLEVTLLGTAGGPPPLAGRYGISSALTVNGRTYLVDCGRGAVTQYMRAGLAMPELAGIFLTHLHADHTADYFQFPLLCAGFQGPMGFQKPIDVFGPGPGGTPSDPPPEKEWVAPGRPAPGTRELTRLSNLAFAQSSDAFIAEGFGTNPADLLHVHDLNAPASSGAGPDNTAPMMKPFTVTENDDLRVTAVLVPHGAVFPAYAYRFDTDHGSVVFSGDTAPHPNLITLAHHTDLLVHEVVDLDSAAKTGVPQAVLEHHKKVHTDITKLGSIAARSEARALALTHFTPADPRLVSTRAWQRKLQDSARSAHYSGHLTVGEDLMRIPVTHRRHAARS